jgi:hypothetical protein
MVYDGCIPDSVLQSCQREYKESWCAFFWRRSLDGNMFRWEDSGNAFQNNSKGTRERFKYPTLVRLVPCSLSPLATTNLAVDKFPQTFSHSLLLSLLGSRLDLVKLQSGMKSIEFISAYLRLCRDWSLNLSVGDQMQCFSCFQFSHPYEAMILCVPNDRHLRKMKLATFDVQEQQLGRLLTYSYTAIASIPTSAMAGGKINQRPLHIWVE